LGDREKVNIVKQVDSYEKEMRENYNKNEKQYINRGKLLRR
jgi:hypothetical protein